MQPKKKKPTATAKSQLARLRVRNEILVEKAKQQHLRSMLTFAGADKGRRNKDWKAPISASADYAIIPDNELLNARARQIIRDNPIGAAAVRACVRNVVRKGIITVPKAQPEGMPEELVMKFNNAWRKDFEAWASSAFACDVAEKQTYWQKQQLAVSERFSVGEHFIVWSYEPNPLFVGLKLQAFEPEQLDTYIRGYVDPITGETRDVRGGIEINDKGAAVAYHFQPRPRNDYSPRPLRDMVPIRIEANRVLHYFRQTRVNQTHGVTELAPVMQRIRDVDRKDSADLWASIMEACIGLIIQRNNPTPYPYSPTVQPASGDTGATSSGMRTADMVPGMIFEGQPGEEIKPFAPQRPGNTYEPYIRTQQRLIGAGMGMSYEQITRDFTQGTYSSQRQSMLEDGNEWSMEQDLLIEKIIDPIKNLWLALWVYEGRAPISFDMFARDRFGWGNVTYVLPPKLWIDPEKEISALLIGVKMGFITLEEVGTQYGVDIVTQLKQRAREEQSKQQLGLPATGAEPMPTQPQPQPAIPRLQPPVQYPLAPTT